MTSPMTTRTAAEKRDQVLGFKEKHNLTNEAVQKKLGIADTAYKRWMRGEIEVPDPVSVAIDLYESGEMPAPEVTANMDRTAVVKDIKQALNLSSRELADATGFPLVSVRHWSRLTNPANIKPASLIALAGRIKLRYGYRTPLIPDAVEPASEHDTQGPARPWDVTRLLEAQSKVAFENHAHNLGLPLDRPSETSGYDDPNTQNAWESWCKAIEWTLLSGGAAATIHKATPHSQT